MELLIRHSKTVQALLILTGLAFMYLAITFINSGFQSESVIPTPGPPPQDETSYPENLDEYLVAIIEGQSNAPEAYRVSTTEKDIPIIKEHIIRTAAQRGWIIHNPKRFRMDIVLPRDQTHEIEELSQDPLAWATKNSRDIPEQTDSDPVNLRIELRESDIEERLTAVLKGHGIPNHRSSPAGRSGGNPPSVEEPSQRKDKPRQGTSRRITRDMSQQPA